MFTAPSVRGGGCETSCLIHGGSGRTCPLRLNRRKENGNLCKLKSESSFASPPSIDPHADRLQKTICYVAISAQQQQHQGFPIPHRSATCVSNCEGKGDRPTHTSHGTQVHLASVARGGRKQVGRCMQSEAAGMPFVQFAASLTLLTSRHGFLT